MTSLKLVTIATLILAAVLNIIYNNLQKEDAIPKINGKYWGSKNKSNEIRGFKINITDKVLNELKQSILNDELPKPLPGIKNDFGINMKTLQELRDYLLTHYDWRKRESYLNQFPHYKTTIQGLDIHFVHIKPNTTKRVIPLIFMHGWPGSFSEFYNIIPKLLTNEKDFTFEIVIPSMPGFFFSDTPEEEGWNSYECAYVLKALMERLGCDKFYVYGTDWGTIVARSMAILYPDNILGVNVPLCGSLRKISYIKLATELLVLDWFSERTPRNNYELLRFIFLNSGYFHFKATFPDVLGLSFRKSPMGFMAHVLTLLIMGNNPSYINSEQTNVDLFDKDIILDQIMLYWTTDSIASSIRIYKYYIKLVLFEEKSTNVPYSCPIIENEIFSLSDWVLSDAHKNIIQRTYFNNTGHFYTLEKDMRLQESFSKDFIEFVAKTLK